MVEWFSYSLGILSIIIAGLFVRISFYLYKKRYEQITNEQQDAEKWYSDTVEYAQRIQVIREDFEVRPGLQQPDAKNEIEFISENLSSHHINGGGLNIDNQTLSLLEKTAEKCREVVRVNTGSKDAGIGSQLKAADEYAEELEQSAKKQL